MERENGERKEEYEEANREYYVDPPNGFPQNNIFTPPPYSQAHQQQLLDPNSYFNLVSLLNMPSSYHHNATSGFELLLNLQPPQHHPQPSSSSLFQIHDHGHPYAYGAGVLTSAETGMFAVDHEYTQQGEVFEFSHPKGLGFSGGGGGSGSQDPQLRSCPKNSVTERQRRQTFNDKFQHLRSLLPNPNKNDKASIVGDAIEYIKELKRIVNELKILVEKKRCLKQRNKRYKNTIEDDDNTVTNVETAESLNSKTIKSEQVQDQSLRSSWLQRKCKDTEIDVRIGDDEVVIKLVQRKKMVNCLLYVSRSFDELQLDVQHVTGGNVGDYHSFLFNTKVLEGSSTYAAAIANKLIEVVEGSVLPTLTRNMPSIL